MVEMELKGMDKVFKGLKKSEQITAKAVNATSRDFKSRAPSWISQEVNKQYTIKKKDVATSKKGTRVKGKVKVAGVVLDNTEIQYIGTVLTPTHFKMTPRVRPKKSHYVVNVEIMRGKKKSLPSNVFLGGTGSDIQIPFRRETKRRLPIKALKTISVPQMITQQKVSKNIQKRITVELDKRLEHNLQRFSKK